MNRLGFLRGLLGAGAALALNEATIIEQRFWALGGIPQPLIVGSAAWGPRNLPASFAELFQSNFLERKFVESLSNDIGLYGSTELRRRVSGLYAPLHDDGDLGFPASSLP